MDIIGYLSSALLLFAAIVVVVIVFAIMKQLLTLYRLGYPKKSARSEDATDAAVRMKLRQEGFSEDEANEAIAESRVHPAPDYGSSES